MENSVVPQRPLVVGSQSRGGLSAHAPLTAFYSSFVAPSLDWSGRWNRSSSSPASRRSSPRKAGRPSPGMRPGAGGMLRDGVRMPAFQRRACPSLSPPGPGTLAGGVGVGGEPGSRPEWDHGACEEGLPGGGRRGNLSRNSNLLVETRGSWWRPGKTHVSQRTDCIWLPLAGKVETSCGRRSAVSGGVRPGFDGTQLQDWQDVVPRFSLRPVRGAQNGESFGERLDVLILGSSLSR